MSNKNDKEEQINEQMMTYDTYAAMPEDGMRYEIFEGKLSMMSLGPSPTHQSVSGELEFIMRQGCKSNYVIYDAPLDVILSQTTVLQPDIIMIHRNRLSIVTKRGIEGAPDLVVEIVSPGSRKRDMVDKKKMYAKYGVPEYWIVDTVALTLEQYHLQDSHYDILNLYEGDEVVFSEKLPCVSFVLSDIFKEFP